jgi:hypothetical protein
VGRGKTSRQKVLLPEKEFLFFFQKELKKLFVRQDGYSENIIILKTEACDSSLLQSQKIVLTLFSSLKIDFNPKLASRIAAGPYMHEIISRAKTP